MWTRFGALLTAVLAATVLAAGCGGDDSKKSSGGSSGGQSDSDFGGGGDCQDADDALQKAARDHVGPLTVKAGGGEGTVDRITVEVCRTTEENATATVTVYGMSDDSVRDVRHDIRLIKTGGLWQVTDDQDTTRCQPGRGPQEFSGTLCE